MNSKKIQHVKLWMVMVAAVVFWTIGAGFFGDLAAKSDETYEGLKIFADVIQLIEKEYVDDDEQYLRANTSLNGGGNKIKIKTHGGKIFLRKL